MNLKARLLRTGDALSVERHTIRVLALDSLAEIDRLNNEAVSADLRIANDALVIAGLTAERDEAQLDAEFHKAAYKTADGMALKIAEERDALRAANKDLQDWYDAAIADAKRYKHLRDDCFRVSVNGIMFVSVPNKWLSEHQTTTAEDDAAIDAMKGQP